MLAGARWYLTLLLLMGANACATAEPVVRLTPREKIYKWQQGRGVLLKERNGLKVALAYDRNFERHVAFRLEVLNGSNQAVLFEPAQSYCAYCVPGTVANPTIQCPASAWLADPEEMAANLEVQQASQVAQHANQQSWNAGLVLLDGFVAGAVAGASQRHHGSLVVVPTSGRLEAEEARHVSSQIRFGSALEFWQSATFRRTTLLPGEASSGLILAPRNANAPVVVVRLQLGSEAFDFVFSQLLLNEKASRPRPGYKRM